jgi:hypothetical protein
MVAEQRARRRSRYAYQVAVQVWRRSSCEPRAADVRPSLPARPDSGSDDQAAHHHSDRFNPVRQCGRSRRTDGFRDPGRSGQRGCSGCGHRTRVRPDTPDHLVVWTPVAWTPDVRPTGWTDVRPHGGQRTRTQRRPAWPASGHPGRPRRRRPPAGRPQPRSGCSVCGAGQSMTAPR